MFFYFSKIQQKTVNQIIHVFFICHNTNNDSIYSFYCTLYWHIAFIITNHLPTANVFWQLNGKNIYHSSTIHSSSQMQKMLPTIEQHILTQLLLAAGSLHFEEHYQYVDSLWDCVLINFLPLTTNRKKKPMPKIFSTMIN